MGGPCRRRRGLLAARKYKVFDFTKLFIPSFGSQIAPAPGKNLSLKFEQPKSLVSEDEEKT
jgi:hypothetical protein